MGRKSNIFFALTALQLVLFSLLFIHSFFARKAALPAIREKSDMVSRLGLTDLCIFTDARYTRNPSVADLNTPFQDYPLSFEHFPSGSLIPAPKHLLRGLKSSEAADR